MSLMNRLWQKKTVFTRLLYPVTWVYQWSIQIRKWFLVTFKQQTFSVPIIVVGNLSTGGVGKTPLVIALVEYFRTKGLSVGVVSRGYKAQTRNFPHEVTAHDTARLVGDEPFLIALKTQVPVVIAPKRVQAVEYLIRHHSVQIIISDDGLQHYRMDRDIEIVVIDGVRKLGNQLCLPAGPLREPKSRLKSIDFHLVNGGEWPNTYRMDLMPESFISLKTNQPVSSGIFIQPVTAIAGIGHPERFFFNVKSVIHLPSSFSLSRSPSILCSRFFEDHY